MKFVEILMMPAKLWILKAKNFVIRWKLGYDIMTQTNNELNLKRFMDNFIFVYKNVFHVKQKICQLQLPNWKLFDHSFLLLKIAARNSCYILYFLFENRIKICWAVLYLEVIVNSNSWEIISFWRISRSVYFSLKIIDRLYQWKIGFIYKVFSYILCLLGLIFSGAIF